MARLSELFPAATALGERHRWYMRCGACGHQYIRQFQRQWGCDACGSRDGLVLIRPVPLGPPVRPEDGEGMSERDQVSVRLERLRAARVGRARRAADDQLWVQGAASTLDGPFALVVDEDRFYEEATALVRVPSVLNWPHGRIRPRCRVTNEGKARGFWVGRRKA